MDHHLYSDVYLEEFHVPSGNISCAVVSVFKMLIASIILSGIPYARKISSKIYIQSDIIDIGTAGGGTGGTCPQDFARNKEVPL